MNKRPKITIGGAVATPAYWRIRRYVATERRDYPDGISVIVLESVDNGSTKMMAWNRAKGTGENCERAVTKNARNSSAYRTTVMAMRRRTT